MASFVLHGELLDLCGADVLIRKDIGLVRLAETKTSAAKGISEVITLKNEWALMVLDTLVGYLREQRLLQVPIWRGSKSAFRLRFKQYCRSFKVHHMGFRPYSLRRGGATALFQDALSYDAALGRACKASYIDSFRRSASHGQPVEPTLSSES